MDRIRQRINDLARRAFDQLDDHPLRVLLALFVAIVSALAVWSVLEGDPVFLAAADSKARLRVLEQIGPAAATLLAASLTILAILHAFPDRPRVQELRARRGWNLLQRTLFVAAGCFLATLVLTVIAVGIDDGPAGIESLEIVLIATSVTGLAALLMGGVALVGVLLELEKPVSSRRRRRGAPLPGDRPRQS